MVVGTLSLGQKGQTSRCSTLWMQYTVCSGIVVYVGGDNVFGAKRSNQWMQCTVDAVHNACSRIVVYSDGDIVFGAKESNQWMHWMQYAVDAVCSGHSMQWMQYLHSGSSGCSGIVVYGGVSAVYCTKDTVLTFLYQRQCPHHHIPLFHCIHCILHPLCTVSTASTGLTFLHQRQCPHNHIPLFHCVLCTAYCVHCFDLFVSKTMSPPPYTTIPLHTASTVYCINCIHWFDLFAPKTMSPNHIPLFHCVLRPLHTMSTVHCVHTIESLLCDSYTA